MASHTIESVTSVHHWNDTMFSFCTTRSRSLRFENGHFLMLGLQAKDRPLLRAYSIASPNHADHLEFLSIKVPYGALTSRLQHLRVGDQILMGSKPVGTLVVDDLRPGRNLYLLATGTGLAPFMSIVRDPSVYARFERVVVVHSVRFASELAYAAELRNGLAVDPLLGEFVNGKLTYLPVCTRDAGSAQKGGALGVRIPELISGGLLTRHLGLPPLDAAQDRAMICGNPHALQDIRAALDTLGFSVSPGTGEQGDYVYERAFVER